MAFCIECGKTIVKDAKFCPNCGSPVNNNFESTDIYSGDTISIKSQNLYGTLNLERLPEGYEISGRYVIKEKIGQGGFACVYRAYDKNVETDKALKVFSESFSSDREAIEDLKAEGKIMMNLTHDRIVRIFDVSTENPIKYIDMEYVEGKSLNEYKLDFESKKVPEEKVIEIGIKIAEGLGYARLFVASLITAVPGVFSGI